MNKTKQMSETIRLGMLLAVSGGFMDAYSYIERDQVFANAQTGKVSINLKNASVKELFNAIESQTPYRFSYRSVEVENKKGVTISVKNAASNLN